MLELESGDQKNWNRLCELVAWMTLHIIKTIPYNNLSEVKNLKEYIDKYPPPGYVNHG